MATALAAAMRRIICLTCDEIRPSGGAIVRRLHGDTPAAPYLNELAQDARSIIDRVGRPRAVFEQIDQAAFDRIYGASPANQPYAPLPRNVSQAAGLALFAATLGPEVDPAIRARCEAARAERPSDRFAFGHCNGWDACMLEAFAAAAAERLAQMAADQFAASLPNVCAPAFPYLPGSCGWDASGVATVLASLEPDELGDWRAIASEAPSIGWVAGVLIAAPAALHRTTAQFPCCASCGVHRCLSRVTSTSSAA